MRRKAEDVVAQRFGHSYYDAASFFDLDSRAFEEAVGKEIELMQGEKRPTAQALTVRPRVAEGKDLKEFLLHNPSLKEQLEKEHGTQNPAILARKLRKELAEGMRVPIAARTPGRRGKFVGYALAAPPSVDKGEGVIGDVGIWVRKEFRRRAIATQLLRSILRSQLSVLEKAGVRRVNFTQVDTSKRGESIGLSGKVGARPVPGRPGVHSREISLPQGKHEFHPPGRGSGKGEEKMARAFSRAMRKAVKTGRKTRHW
ncbi:MAG TPA: GNAT family N-acetyltransferase [archaeon]|nr:GNAT family N-acetyltransferase [archaeon]